MKLRIDANTLRLRLSEAEVHEFAATGRVTASIQLGPNVEQRLTYSLERSPAAAELLVEYADNRIVVRVPAAAAETWTGTKLNGLSARICLPEGGELRILVEKDLDCRH
jgi:hypothetical protein